MIKIKPTIAKNSPTLLMLAGVGLMFGAIYKACTNTKKYLVEIDRAKLDIADNPKDANLEEIDIPKKQKLIIMGKCYWQTAVFTAASVFCFTKANGIHLKRNAALAAAYGISEAKRLELMNKTRELLGDKKADEIQEKIAEDTVTRDKPPESILAKAPVDEFLCYDSVFGRYFYSTTEKIKRVENVLNEKLFREMYVSVNDMWMELGLSQTDIGKELGWNVNDGLMHINIVYTESRDGISCIVISYDINPRQGYGDLH